MRPLFRVPLIYGAIAGALGFMLSVGLYYLGPHPFLIPVYLDYRMFLFPVFLFFTLKEIRDYHQGGILYFSQGSIACFVFLITFSLLAATLTGVFAAIQGTGFLQSYINLSIQQIKSLPADVLEKIGKDVVDRNLKLLPSTNAFDLAQLYFSQSLLIGLFMSIIMSVILRRQQKT